MNQTEKAKLSRIVWSVLLVLALIPALSWTVYALQYGTWAETVRPWIAVGAIAVLSFIFNGWHRR